MNIKSIGETINRLRKEKGITQEELGKAAGVSTQAVSKWECGGVPDTELLPVIADYFQVSIDMLFGRNIADYSDIDTLTAKYIASLDPQQRMAKAFEHCWALERSILGNGTLEEHTSLSSIRSKEKNMVYSQMLLDSGITLMSLQESLPYFLLMPQPCEGWNKSVVEGVDYISLFKLLSDESIFNTILLLYRRENKPFTSKLLNKALSIPTERAEEILESLKLYKIVEVSEVELDDEIQKIYSFIPNPAFIALLTFSKELISKPRSFNNYCGNRQIQYLK